MAAEELVRQDTDGNFPADRHLPAKDCRLIYHDSLGARGEYYGLQCTLMNKRIVPWTGHYWQEDDAS